MDISVVMHQTVPWQVRTGVNQRGDAEYGAVVAVRARAVGKSKDVVAKDGSVTTVIEQVTLLTEPAVGDLLNGREVVLVTSLVDVAGNTVGYQAATR